jgi:hypothetical protein
METRAEETATPFSSATEIVGAGGDWAAAVQTRASVRTRARMRSGNILLSDARRGWVVWRRVGMPRRRDGLRGRSKGCGGDPFSFAGDATAEVFTMTLHKWGGDCYVGNVCSRKDSGFESGPPTYN